MFEHTEAGCEGASQSSHISLSREYSAIEFGLL